MSEAQSYRKHPVPESYLDKWQETINTLALILEVPAGLIMRVLPSEIEVLVASRTEDNPYAPHEKASLETGLYCETVMATRSPLHVPNALEDAEWKDNPDIELNMISYLGMPLIWPDGSVFGTICVLDNKTRHYTHLYRNLLDQFRQIIERDFELLHRTKELEDALHQLAETQEQLVFSEKMASLGNLVAGIAHEINNPIGVINTAAYVSELCVSKIHDVLTEDDSLIDTKFQGTLDTLKENSKVAKVSAARVTKVVQSLRSFAALDQAELQQTDIHQDLEDTLVLLEHQLGSRISVHKSYGDVRPVECYRSQLNQVFMSLLLNAAEAIEGEGTITIQTHADGDTVFIAISDTGHGMTPDVMERLFDFAFANKGSRMGMSVGLATVRQIIERHHGNIRVTSKPGEGTTFRIELPLRQRHRTGPLPIPEGA